jgi:hypothetical protein
MARPAPRLPPVTATLPPSAVLLRSLLCFCMVIAARLGSPRLETVVMPLPGDAPVAKIVGIWQRDPSSHSQVSGLNWHRRNAKPIHLQCNPVAVAKVFASTINSAVHTMLVLNLKAKSSGGEGGFDA